MCKAMAKRIVSVSIVIYANTTKPAGIVFSATKTATVWRLTNESMSTDNWGLMKICMLVSLSKDEQQKEKKKQERDKQRAEKKRKKQK